MPTHFDFSEQREQSAIKTEIVIKYFDAWSKIMSSRFPKLAYIDLFAGPGIYDDGSESTPIIILKRIIQSPILRSKFVVCLNDKDLDNYQKLVSNISQLDNLSLLKSPPKISNLEVTYDTPQKFNYPKIPCFCFIDPAGYNGLSLNLLKVFGQDYGSDIIFFFNFNDINRALSNSRVTNNMKQLFGDSHYHLLMSKISGKSGQIRESIIINEMSEAMKDIGMTYPLPFRFKFEGKNRTSHYIIFASKNITGFNIMKDIMYKIGEKDFNGIGKFEFIPSCDKEENVQLSIIDLFSTPFEQFKTELRHRYSGRTIAMGDLYKIDSPNTPFVSKQYKSALIELELSGKITCNKPYSQRRRNTFSDNTIIKF